MPRKLNKMDFNSQREPRQMFQGNWTCSKCGAEITELPFEPDGSRPLYCRNCHQKRSQGRDDNRRRY